MFRYSDLSKCPLVTFCEGHLGKYDNCRDEAIDFLTLEGTFPSTGDVDFRGHFTMVELESVETVDMGNRNKYAIEPGHYLVIHYTSGMVDVFTYDTKTALDHSFALERAMHEVWDDSIEHDLYPEHVAHEGDCYIADGCQHDTEEGIDA